MPSALMLCSIDGLWRSLVKDSGTAYHDLLYRPNYHPRKPLPFSFCTPAALLSNPGTIFPFNIVSSTTRGIS